MGHAWQLLCALIASAAQTLLRGCCWAAAARMRTMLRRARARMSGMTRSTAAQSTAERSSFSRSYAALPRCRPTHGMDGPRLKTMHDHIKDMPLLGFPRWQSLLVCMAVSPTSKTSLAIVHGLARQSGQSAACQTRACQGTPRQAAAAALVERAGHMSPCTHAA